MEAEECWFVGPHGAHLAVNGDKIPCMSKQRDDPARWTVKSTGGGDGRHFLIASDGRYLAVTNRGEQSFRLVPSAEPYAMWTMVPIEGSGGLCNLQSFYGTYLASLDNDEQTLYMSPNNKEWERWRRVPCQPAAAPQALATAKASAAADAQSAAGAPAAAPAAAEAPPAAAAAPPASARAGEDASVAGASTGAGCPADGSIGAAAAEAGLGGGEALSSELQEALGLVARRDAQALEALFVDAVASGRVTALLGAADADGNSLLHKCAVLPGSGSPESEDSVRIVEVLMRHGACPNAANVIGETPLLCAVRASAPRALVRKLLEARADPDHADNLTGDTALMEAACMGDASLCEALLQAQADPSLQNFHGLTALDLAVAAGHDAVAALPGLAPASLVGDADEEVDAEVEAEVEVDDPSLAEPSPSHAGALAARAALQERCRERKIPFDVLGEQGAEEVLHEVLRLETLRQDELRRQGQALNLQTEHCYQHDELFRRCRQYYIWQAMPMETLESECEAHAAHVLGADKAEKGAAPKRQRTREELVEALVVATWGGATKNQKLSDGRAKGIPVDRLESPEQAAQLIEQLEKFEKGSVSTLKQEYMKRGFAPPGNAGKEELLALVRNVLLWEALPVPDLRQMCRRRGLKVSKSDQTRSELMELLATASWEERGIPRSRLNSFVVAQGILSSVEGFEAKSVEDLEAICKRRNLPVEPRPDRQILLARLRDALVWEHLPMDELINECKKQGISVEEKPGAASGQPPDAKAPSGLRHSAFTPSPFTQARFSWGKSEELMLGRWQYGSKPTEYRLSKAEDGQLHFEGPHSRTGTVSGSLSLYGQWWQCQLTSSEGECVGSIRLQYDEADGTVVSNFKSVGREDWGKDLIASRVESDPLQPSARRLLGRWFYGSKPLEYKVGMTSDGKLSFSGPHSRAGTLNGILEQRGEWMQAGLTSHNGEMIGLIRLRYVEEDGTTVSNFKSPNMDDWGKDIIAKKADNANDTGQAGTAPPGAVPNGSGAGGGARVERKTLMARLVKAAEDRMKNARGVAWERFESKEAADEVFKMVLDLEQLPEATLRREYERLNLPQIAALTCQQILEAVRSWCVWGALPMAELEKEFQRAEKAGELLSGQEPDDGRGPPGGPCAIRRMPPVVTRSGAAPAGLWQAAPRNPNVRIELGPQGRGGPLGKGGRFGPTGGRGKGAFTMIGRPQARAPAAAASPPSAGSAPSSEERRLDPHDQAVRTLSGMQERYRGDFSEAEVKKYWDTTCKKTAGASGGPADEERRNWLREQLLQAMCVRIYESKGIPARRLGDVARARRVHQRILTLEKMTVDELWREVTQAASPVRRETDRLLLLRRLKAAAVWQELPWHELWDECKKAGIHMSRSASGKDCLQRLIRKSWHDEGPGARPKPKPAPKPPPRQQRYQAPPRPRQDLDASKMAKEFARLGIPTTAGAADVRKAYRKLALKYHPDKNPGQAQEAAAAKFREVTAAYEALCGYVKTRERQ